MLVPKYYLYCTQRKGKHLLKQPIDPDKINCEGDNSTMVYARVIEIQGLLE